MVTAAAMLLAVPALAACSSRDSLAATKSATARATKSAASTTATTQPVAASTYQPPVTAPRPLPVDKVDDTQAGIFVLVWVVTLNYGYAHNDADPLRASISLGCFTCSNWVIDIQNRKNDGTSQTGGGIHIRQLVLLGASGGNFQFRALLDRDPGETTGQDGTNNPVPGSTGQIVDMTVGPTTSSLSGKSSWTMKSITEPQATSPSPAPSPPN